MAAKKGVSFRLAEKCIEQVKAMAESARHLSEAQIIEIAVDRLYEVGGPKVVVGEADEAKKKGK